MTAFRFLILVLAVLALAACSRTVVPAPKTAAAYLQEGEDYFERGLYEEAVDAWQKVRDSYYSPEMNVLAEMKIAEAYFLAERYVEAATAYEDFIKQHPDHPRTEEALYRLGLSYYRQMLSVDRDQTATRNALVTFESLLRQYPETGSAEEVRAYVRRCRNRLAAHEMYVGRFYLKTGHPEAAIGRLAGIFDTYPNFRDRDAALYHLGRAYLETGRRDQAAEAFNTLYREFPGSEYIGPAQEFLEERY